MTETQVGITSVLRRYFVGACNFLLKALNSMAKVSISAALVFGGSSAARADAWAEFETRCLVPFLDGENPIVAGLEPVPNPQILTNETIHLVQPPDGEFSMMAMFPGAYQTFSCSITTPSGIDASPLVNGFTNWSEKVLEDESFQASEYEGFDHQLLSVDHPLGLFDIKALFTAKHGRSSVSIGRK